MSTLQLACHDRGQYLLPKFFCSQLRWVNGKKQKAHIVPISLDGAAVMLQPPHAYGLLATGHGENNYKGKLRCLFQMISTVFLWNPAVPSFSLSLGPCAGTQTITQGGDIPDEALLALLHSCATVGSAPLRTAPYEVIRAFSFQRLYISAIYGREEVRSSYQCSTQEQFISIQIELKRYLNHLQVWADQLKVI